MITLSKWSMVLFLTVLLLMPQAGSWAKDVHLRQGESYSEGNLTVTCKGGAEAPETIRLKECQYWDDFKKICLFEKTTFVYRNLQCTEECQHWDDFNTLCHFQTLCVFHQGQETFVRTDCAEFDEYSNTCLRTREKIIGRSGKRGQ